MITIGRRSLQSILIKNILVIEPVTYSCKKKGELTAILRKVLYFNARNKSIPGPSLRGERVAYPNKSRFSNSIMI